MMNNTDNRENLVRLIRYFRLGKRRHHITVHSNGRCLIRASAVKRFRLGSFVSVSVTISQEDALLVFFTDDSGNSRLVHPVRSNGTVCKCLYFYSRQISSRAASSQGNRFRFVRSGSLCRDGSLLIRLSLSPVRDFQSILFNK